MKPEAQVEIILHDWLKDKSKFVKEIYFNRTNSIGAQVFTTKGVNKKPDFIIKIDRGYGEEFIAVEIKDNSKSSNVYDASKIIDIYYENYLTQKTFYFIDNQSINISYFLIATQGSVESKLLSNHNELKIMSNVFDFGSHRKYLVNFGNEPEFEWNGTQQFLRNLFAKFRDYRKEKNLKKVGGAGVGILTSKINCIFNKDGFPEYINENKPHMFIMNFNNYNPKYKTKWGCRYWMI